MHCSKPMHVHSTAVMVFCMHHFEPNEIGSMKYTIVCYKMLLLAIWDEFV